MTTQSENSFTYNTPHGAYFVSDFGRQHNAPTTPLIVYGHDAYDTAKFIASYSTISTIAIERIEHLNDFLKIKEHIGIFAMSPEGSPGEARQAIQAVQANPSPGALIYGAWDSNMDRALELGLEYGAHAVIMPDIDAQEMFNYIFQTLEAVQQKRPAPQALQGFVDEMRQACPNSPFWKIYTNEVREIY